VCRLQNRRNASLTADDSEYRYDAKHSHVATASVVAMLKWAVTARCSPISTSGSGLSGTTPGGATENYVSAASRAGAWPTFNDVSVAQPSEVRSMADDSDDDGDSLSAYDDDTSTLEQMISIDFNDDSQV